jgi:hypothetical protein
MADESMLVSVSAARKQYSLMLTVVLSSAVSFGIAN